MFKTEIFDNLRNSLAEDWWFASTFSLVLFFVALVIPAVTYLALYVRRVEGRPHSLLAEFVLVTGVALLAFSVIRQTLVLRNETVYLFDIAAVATCFAFVTTAAYSSTTSIFGSSIAALIAVASFILLLAPPESQTVTTVAELFTMYSPYSADIEIVAKGLFTFIVASLVIMHFLSRYNERKKSELLLGNKEGLDPAALEKVSVAISVLIALLVTLFVSGVSLPALSLATGAIIAGVGFATRDIISNIAAGLVLIWDETFKVDDVISIDGGGYGWIDRLALRHAVIKDRNDVSILIPYTKLISSTIQNWTHEENKVRLKIDIGVDYDSDLKLARECLLRAAANSNSRVMLEPGPKVTVIAAGDSAIQLQLRFWIDTPKEGIRNVMSDVLEGMISELKKHDVPIPFTTVDINLKSATKIQHEAAQP